MMERDDLNGVKYSSFISTWRLGIRTAVILLLVTFVLSSSLFHSPNIQGNNSQGILIYRSQGSEPNVRGAVKPASGYLSAETKTKVAQNAITDASYFS